LTLQVLLPDNVDRYQHGQPRSKGRRACIRTVRRSCATVRRTSREVQPLSPRRVPESCRSSVENASRISARPPEYPHDERASRTRDSRRSTFSASFFRSFSTNCASLSCCLRAAFSSFERARSVSRSLASEARAVWSCRGVQGISAKPEEDSTWTYDCGVQERERIWRFRQQLVHVQERALRHL
jgi:hypothetical protein